MDIFRHSTSKLTADAEPAEDSQGVLITGLHAQTEIVPAQYGFFLKFTWEKPSARQVIDLGTWNQIERWTACHRYEPFWMKPCTGTELSTVPIETQFLLCELADKTCLAVVPIIDGSFRASLQGTGDDRIELVVESGDPAVVGNSGVLLYLALDSYHPQLMDHGAQDVKNHLGIFRSWLTEDGYKPYYSQFVSHSIEPEGLGWCTWDAFYQDVSHDKVREGLQSFKDGGISPKYLILDDGWQSVKTMPSGERRLTAFAANEKFPGDLAPTVKMAKLEFGIEKFFVWHALHGYWGGVDGDSLSGYDVRSLERKFSEGILHHVPTIADWWGRVQGVVPPKESYRFFQDYHRHLRSQGVDGVKVDNQAALEGTAHSFGVGRVTMMKQYHEALEGSVSVQFGGNLINCMSCASEMFYSMSRPDIVRTSTDFWPNRPESHGLHLYTNAQVSLWFGQFCKPDWDMFQSGHAAGTFHAVGRVVGGSPIYVSDKPGQQNFDLLRKLCDADGTVSLPYGAGIPSRDCLFVDPTKDDILLKIVNSSVIEGALLGVFNARFDPDKPNAPCISGAVSPADAMPYYQERFVLYAHFANEIRVMNYHDTWEIELAPLGCELFSVVGVINDLICPCAAFGDPSLFYGMGKAYLEPEKAAHRANAVQFYSQDTPHFVAWCEQSPTNVTTENGAVEWNYDEVSGRLDIVGLSGGEREIIAEF